MKDLKQILQDECYGKDLEQRRHWYSPAAEAYQQVRPRYPTELIDQVVDIAQLSSASILLEVGCGPAIATPAFAALGCSMVCIEPNPDFYHLAQQTCQSYPQVEFQNCSFEEWQLIPHGFDALLAASSFHWVSPEIGYPKAATALRPDGHLILLWNKELQPRYEIYQPLAEVYQTHAPSLPRVYEDSATQAAILNELGQMAIASGYFRDVITGQIEVEVTYSIDQYLLLLSTYSPYLKLDPQQRQKIFEGLRQVLEQNGDKVDLSYVSAFHVARPVKG
ncbi:class I SAM-dependent methyltransferase [Oscillatoria sp. FACHB-1407]|uniref:class I SAM-dependent methyltransferase n=1 Tax=Oscillatoria sp. FACHB-1407 TaxID=2692847 RepID=UPI0016844FEB|nr:class I SAM-dependent methyltransferase [Oscillatoria sp. FACHB-1407]MBD2461905.1 class I SAM-dependent methyltransferase [Oscillatoria sp. FACHB-1407]